MSTALALQTHSRLPACLSHMLATPSSDEIEQLWWCYQGALKSLTEIENILKSGKYNSALHYLLRSGHQDGKGTVNASYNQYKFDVAVKLLMADYWERAIAKTDIRSHMPAARKQEWYEQITNMTFPDLTLEALYSTLSTLLSERDRFFAERVDGFYRALSGDHVTNSINPTGFYNRFIVANCHEDGSVSSRRADQISDLRYVIGKFVKRDGNPSWHSSNELIKAMLRNPGEWHDVDNGSIQMKVFKKGTIHIQVHPDLAWRLNEVLAILYPKALAPDSRKPNPKVIREFNLTQSLIPFDVLDALADMKPAYERIDNRYGMRGPRIENGYNLFARGDKHLYAKCKALLELIGGVEKGYATFQFDYAAEDVIRKMVVSGVVPDYVSHQYYPTPDELASRMVSMLGALPGSKLLEPSAGLGAIANKLKGNVTCVEVAPLFSEALRAKGLNVVTADFLTWSKDRLAANELFSGIVMNPPFSQGRAYEHICAAMKLLELMGVLVALAPASCARKIEAETPGCEVLSIDPSEFPGVSIDLSIVKVRKTASAS
ncbi:DUF4942 domain-containing protein [Rheinheimera sp.]|uniref:DUF4942 domain-containing protein n=1 Tax=Rheinheimera sp. TaxID=1869214 RepID=UPI004047CCF3